MKDKYMEIKECSKCGIVKAINEFSWKNKQKGRRRSSCKACENEYNKQYREQHIEKINELRRQYYKENREKVNELNRQYYKENREKVNEQMRQYYERNKEKLNERNRQYREQNREKLNEQARQYYEQHREEPEFKEKRNERSCQYYEQNREKINEYSRQYNEQNREKINEWIRQWRANKYKTNPMYRLNKCISIGIRRSLRSGKNSHHWEDLVGYTLKDLIDYLQQNIPAINTIFPEKTPISLESFGAVWEIHHKIPINLWQFEKPEDPEFKQCWALCNLIPVWKDVHNEIHKRQLIINEIQDIRNLYGSE